MSSTGTPNAAPIRARAASVRISLHVTACCNFGSRSWPAFTASVSSVVGVAVSVVGLNSFSLAIRSGSLPGTYRSLMNGFIGSGRCRHAHADGKKPGLLMTTASRAGENSRVAASSGPSRW